MNRAQMIRRLGTFLAGEVDGAVDELAAEILDVILPQVTTVAELEALPGRTLLLCEFGDTFVVSLDRRAPDFRFLATNGEHWSADGLLDTHDHHLTVVWTPEVTR